MAALQELWAHLLATFQLVDSLGLAAHFSRPSLSRVGPNCWRAAPTAPGLRALNQIDKRSVSK